MLDYKNIIKYFSLGILSFAVLVAGIFGIYKLISINSKDSDDPSSISSGNSESEVLKPSLLNLQLSLNQWVDARPDKENVAAIIYDIDNNEIVARHNENAIFDMAQLYQLFIAYEGYNRIESGNWKGNELVEPTGKSRALCLDNTLRFSDVVCSDTLWDVIGRDFLTNEIKSQGFEDTNILKFTSSANDIYELMKMYVNHTTFSNETWARIKDSLLNQTLAKSDNTHNFRQGLPSGFTVAKVHNKSGWFYTTEKKSDKKPSNATFSGDEMILWHTYNDAAIVEFPETETVSGKKVPARNYIIVVMTRETSPQEIVLLSRAIETFIRTADEY